MPRNADDSPQSPTILRLLKLLLLRVCYTNRGGRALVPTSANYAGAANCVTKQKLGGSAHTSGKRIGPAAMMARQEVPVVRTGPTNTHT